MTGKQVSPYGSWASPITPDLLAARGTDLSRGLGQLQLDGEDTYWLEGRPALARNVIVSFSSRAEVTDAIPPPFSARSRAHEYGGGDFLVHGGAVFFTNDADQRFYRRDRYRRPLPITPPGPWRYADPVVDRNRSRMICVREDHEMGDHEPVAALVGIDLLGHSKPWVLVSGNDFYSSPRVSPDGTKLAWLTWNHPDMPWDSTELWVGQLSKEGAVIEAKRVAGGGEDSIFQPEWSPAGFLYFISDRSGWWNLYRLVDDRPQAVCPREADFGVPQWNFGETTYGFASEKRILCAYTEAGAWKLGSIDAESGALTPIPTPYSEIAHLKVRRNHAFFRAASPRLPHEIVRFDVDRRLPLSLRPAELSRLEDADISVPEAIEFPTGDGERARGFFYLPTNAAYEAPAGEKPPLIVIGHGGPTASASTALDLKIQFWTSRGIAVLDVNYRGSSGYGRAYRRALDGRWGVADVEDCVAGARHLAGLELVDGDRMAIRGSSAGGYTCLCALTFTDVFRAGASYYGISDLEALTKDTHKFEAHYTDRLVGPYPSRRDLYRERSPIHSVDRLSCPVIVFQGLEDRIVPPNQAERMVEALRAKGLPVAYLTFPDEGHGFRNAANSRRALEAELYFYSRCFGFSLHDPVPPVEIENLPSA